MYARGIASSKPLVRASGSITKSHLTNKQAPLPMASHEKLTIAKFTSQHMKNFPLKFTVCKGYYGPSEDLKFSEGDRFQAHSVKQSTVVNVEYDNGIRENISTNSSIPFAILFDPHNNTKEAMKGYRFEKVSELIQLPVLPPVLWSRKSYHGSTPDSSVTANELLIVRRVKSRLVGRQQLKVYSHTHKKEKTLYTTCIGSFSTKPRDIALYLSDVLKHMPDIFPCRAVMLNPEVDASAALSLAPHLRAGPCVVTLMHSSIDTSLVISSTLRQGSQAKKLEIPIDLGILVKVDESTKDHQDADPMYEDTSQYALFDQPAQPHPPAPDAVQGSQFYTNVHFGQERSLELQQPQTYPSVESAIEQGHYQTPREMRVPSDPINIESDLPPNYCLLTKHSNEEKGNFERSPSSGEPSSNSPSWRPPLPPPNRIRRDHVRSPDYAYVDTNPGTRSTCAYKETTPTRGQAAESKDNGAVLSTSFPDSAYSDKSFGSSGSGGAIVRRGSASRITKPVHGSGDGIVERSMRSSSISSAGYSYAKSNPPHPHHLPQQPPSNLPRSPHHYSHLRSRSGPPVLPQVSPLSSQPPALPGFVPSQRPLATTRLDSNSDSLVVVQRRASSPLGDNTAVANGTNHPPSRHLTRQESAPAFSIGDAPVINGNPSTLDPLSDVINDLTKMTQELGILEENIFTPDEMSPTSEGAPAAPAVMQQQPLGEAQEQKGQMNIKQSDASLPPEVIEKHKAYLKAMDNFQVLRLLEIMGLEQYTPTFRQEQINGDILSTCDDALLNEELKITSRLHRMRLLRVIEGAYSVHDIMSGKDGYIFMTSAGKQ